MVRGRMKLARILNESKRQATLQKKKKALIKRLQTLCVLCNAKACMMICDGPKDPFTDDENVWPSRQEAATSVSRFMSLSIHERSKKAITLEKFLEHMLVKETKKLEALQMKNEESEMEEMLHKLVTDPTSVENKDGKFSRLFFYIEDLIKKIEKEESSSQSAINVNVA